MYPQPPRLLKYVEAGGQLSASAINAYTRNAQREFFFNEGFSGDDNVVQANIPFSFDELVGYNNTGGIIPAHSVFSIESPGLAFERAEPRVNFKQYEAADKLLFTNLKQDYHANEYRATLIGRHSKYLFKYNAA